LSGPSVSPSPRKVKTRAPPDIQPRKLSFISEEWTSLTKRYLLRGSKDALKNDTLKNSKKEWMD
jgi:hypothetical protein